MTNSESGYVDEPDKQDPSGTEAVPRRTAHCDRGSEPYRGGTAHCNGPSGARGPTAHCNRGPERYRGGTAIVMEGRHRGGPRIAIEGPSGTEAAPRIVTEGPRGTEAVPRIVIKGPSRNEVVPRYRGMLLDGRDSACGLWLVWFVFCWVVFVLFSTDRLTVFPFFHDDLGTMPTRRPYSWKKMTNRLHLVC